MPPLSDKLRFLIRLFALAFCFLLSGGGGARLLRTRRMPIRRHAACHERQRGRKIEALFAAQPRRVAATAALIAWSCAAPQGLAPSQAPPSLAGGTLAPYEQIVGTAIENKGVARFERFGDRWVLTILCKGVHSTYLDDTPIDLNQYVAGYASVRYQYVVRTLDVQCVRAPCPPVQERRIRLEQVTPLTLSPEQAKQRERDCQ